MFSRPLDGKYFPNSFLCVIAFSICLITGCSGDRENAVDGVVASVGESFSVHEIGVRMAGFPWVTGLKVVDLDQDGYLDVVFSEGRLSEVIWLRNKAGEGFEEVVLESGIAGPAGFSVVDVDNDNDYDIAVGGMGIITPSDEKIGSFSILVNDGNQNFTRVEVLDRVARVARVEAGDFDGDGLVDFVLALFGYFEGETRVLFSKGNITFDSVVISMLEGAVDVPVADYDNDGDLDIALLVSQDWEEIYLFDNSGDGTFEQRLLWGSRNKDYGSSGLRAADLNQDGLMDLIYTNGDGFDYATPGARPWHGVQWLANLDRGEFEYRRIGDQLGSYSPLVSDVDGDGDLDVVVCCAFNDWSDPEADSLVCFYNDGQERFEKVSLAKKPTHLILVDQGDLDGDGEVEFVTGALHFYPPYDNLSRVSLWKRNP